MVIKPLKAKYARSDRPGSFTTRDASNALLSLPDASWIPPPLLPPPQIAAYPRRGDGRWAGWVSRVRLVSNQSLGGCLTGRRASEPSSPITEVSPGEESARRW
jgi:hypothetical protein